ncbi:MAG: hypothetical protein PHT34_04090 [Oscillospiraceae bacterium]|nr:hypothetical protein [Oscillospiraceae bacterium]
MKLVFMIAFVLFAAAQLYLIIGLRGKHHKLGYQATAAGFVLFCLYLIFAFFCRFNIPYSVLLLCMITLFLNSFVGYFLNYFEKSYRFDRYLHGFGSFSFAFLGYFTIIALMPSGGGKLFRSLFLVFFGVTLGAVYEIMEAIQDTRRHIKMQKGLKDTNFDLIFDLTGSVLAGLLFFLFCR